MKIPFLNSKNKNKINPQEVFLSKEATQSIKEGQYGVSNAEANRKHLLDLAQKIEDFTTSLIAQKRYEEHTKFVKEFSNLRKAMIEKYGEDRFYQTELYHASNHSTPPPGIKLIFDLPGGEWAEFIEKKANDFGLE